MSVTDNLEQIVELIKDIKEQDETLGNILLEGMGMSFNVINAIKEGNVDEAMDVSDKIQVVSNILGFDLEELVMGVMQGNQQDVDKAVDEETLEFITAHTDDYETFINEQKAEAVKDSLSELRNEI